MPEHKACFEATSASAAEVCLPLTVADWKGVSDDVTRTKAVSALENGKVLILPHLPFTLSLEERAYLRPDCVDPETKSIKFSLSQQRLWGMAKKEKDLAVLQNMMRRYAESAHALITQLFPLYTPHLTVGNTSFRPVEAEGRVQSKRHDDRLLHVDAFPSRPTGGARLLRVFTNVHPHEGLRLWRVGEPFVDVATRFLPQIPSPKPGFARLINLLKITKNIRSPYDHYMLYMHDRMKLDSEYQAKVSQTPVAFASGSSWIVFSDQVSHAAIGGQYAFEQTFMLPVEALADPATSPLRILEKLKGIKLH